MNEIYKKALASAIWSALYNIKKMKKAYELCGGDVSAFSEPCPRGQTRNDKGECVDDEGEAGS